MSGRTRTVLADIRYQPLLRSIQAACILGEALRKRCSSVVTNQTRVAVETTVIGTRRDAEIAANRIIDAWMKKRFRETYRKFPIFLHWNLNRSYKRKPQAQRCLGLLSCRLNLDFCAGGRALGMGCRSAKPSTLV